MMEIDVGCYIINQKIQIWKSISLRCICQWQQMKPFEIPGPPPMATWDLHPSIAYLG
jgi:hypothetical protein